jgi:hypothetical protein
VGGWEGKVSKEKKKKKKTGWGRGESKVPKKKKKNRDKGEKKHWEGGGEKIKLQIKTEMRALNM